MKKIMEKTKKRKIKIIAAKHIYSGTYLYNNRWVEIDEDNVDYRLFGTMDDICQGGRLSDGIIDTNYFSPEDYGKEEWDDEDDTTDDYREVEIEIDTDKYFVRYWNFHPDYSIQGHKGGYYHWTEEFDSLDEAEDFLENLRQKYCGEII